MSLWDTGRPPDDSVFKDLKPIEGPIPELTKEQKEELEKRLKPYKTKVTMKTLLMILD